MTKRYYPSPKVKSYRGKGAKAKAYWRAEWWNPPDASGRRKHRVETWPQDRYTKQQAQAECDRIVRYECSAARPDGTTRLVDYWERTFWPLKSARLAHNTRTQYDSIWRCHLEPLHSLPLAEITGHDVDRVIVGMAGGGYAASSCSAVLSLLSEVLGEAHEEGFIQRNPAVRIQVPRTARPKADTRALTEEEARRLRATVAPADRLLWALLATCGLRISEAYGLRSGDLLAGEQIRVERQSQPGGVAPLKNRKPRDVTVPHRLWPDLVKLAGERNGYLWPRPDGSPELRCNRRSHDRLLDARERSGIPDLTYRMLRTTCATLFTGDVADVQAQLGHHSAEFTIEHYRREIEDRRRRAVDDLEARTAPKLRRVK